MKPWQILVGALALIALVILGSLGYRAFLAPVPPTVTPTQVPAESVPINAEGRVVPAQDAALAFEISGRVQETLVSKGQQVQAGQVIARLHSDQLRAQVEGARAALAAARAQQDMLPSQASDEDEELAQAQVDQAAASLEAAELQLENATLTAPFAGRVISLEVDPGAVIAAGAPAVVLADTSRWYVETLDVLEEDAVRIRPGQTATIEVAAYPDRELTGLVEELALNATTYRGNVTYTVRIELPPNPGLDLSWGMTAFVEIQPDATSLAAATATPSNRATSLATATRTTTAQPEAASTATPTMTATSTATVTAAAAGERTHVVSEGENLFRIGLQYGVSVEALREANDLDDNLIYVGQVLTIPAE